MKAPIEILTAPKEWAFFLRDFQTPHFQSLSRSPRRPPGKRTSAHGLRNLSHGPSGVCAPCAGGEEAEVS